TSPSFGFGQKRATFWRRIRAICNRNGGNLQGSRVKIEIASRLYSGRFRLTEERRGSISWPNRLGTLPATSKHCILDLMKKYFLLIPLALGLVAFVPQKAQAGGYFSVSVGPAYCAPYPVYYGAYYPRYYRQYYYYDN